MNPRNSILRNIDWITVTLYFLLVVMGWFNIYAAVYNEDHQSIFDITQRYGKQLIWIAAALVLLTAVLLIDSKFYVFFAYLFYGIFIIILLSVLVLGSKIHGAKAWFEVGGIAIQPSEFAKVATALALARYMGSFNFRMSEWKSLILLFSFIIIPAFIILAQNDTGSAMVFAAFSLVFFREGLNVIYFIIAGLVVLIFFASLVVSQAVIMLCLAGLSAAAYFYLSRNVKNTMTGIFIYTSVAVLLFTARETGIIHYRANILLLLSFAFTLPVMLTMAFINRIRFVAAIAIFLFLSASYSYSVEYIFYHILEKHQQKRINDLFGIEYDPLGSGFNVNQSKIAIGSGGFSGKGFLQGTQTKYNFVPEQDTDFIFCTVGEEWGFIGTSTVFLLFLGLIYRVMLLAERQRSVFSRVYGYCVASILLFHVLVNIGMTIGLTPVIGIPLPFFSYGGSSLWGFTILLFIFLRLDINRTELLA